MGDLISRQMAIKELESGKDKKAKGEIGGFYNQIIENDIEKLKKLPSAQSEIKTDWDTISRQAAIDAVSDACFELRGVFGRCEDALKALPSAQPEIIHCENCKHWKNNHLCECLSRYGTFETPKDFYCGYGKEK